jgi:hypothetical protein
MDRLTVWCCRRRCHPSYRRRRCRPAQPVMVPSRAHTQVVRRGQALSPHHHTATTLTARAVPCGQRLLSAHNLSRTRSPSTTNALTHTDTHTQRTVYPTVRSGGFSWFQNEVSTIHHCTLMQQTRRSRLRTAAHRHATASQSELKGKAQTHRRIAPPQTIWMEKPRSATSKKKWPGSVQRKSLSLDSEGEQPAEGTR